MEKLTTIKKNYQFQIVYKKGKYAATKNIVIYVLRNGTENNRIGITVGKKYGNSVRRNRVKRIVRELIRKYQMELQKGFDIVIVARKTETEPNYYEFDKEMKYLFGKLKMLTGLENG